MNHDWAIISEPRFPSIPTLMLNQACSPIMWWSYCWLFNFDFFYSIFLLNNSFSLIVCKNLVPWHSWIGLFLRFSHWWLNSSSWFWSVPISWHIKLHFLHWRKLLSVKNRRSSIACTMVFIQTKWPYAWTLIQAIFSI